MLYTLAIVIIAILIGLLWFRKPALSFTDLTEFSGLDSDTKAAISQNIKNRLNQPMAPPPPPPAKDPTQWDLSPPVNPQMGSGDQMLPPTPLMAPSVEPDPTQWGLDLSPPVNPQMGSGDQIV